MDDDQRKTLQWLADQRFEEQRALRAAEDNLFNWSTSLFVASLGALTGLKATGMDWNETWRLLLIIGVVAIVLVILFMAYLIRQNYVRNLQALAEIVATLGKGTVPPNALGPMETTNSQLFFYLRWSFVAVIGIVAVTMITLLG